MQYFSFQLISTVKNQKHEQRDLSELASTICLVWSIMVRPKAVTLEEISRHGRTPTVAPDDLMIAMRTLRKRHEVLRTGL
jgi:hypothetical protein